MPVLKSYSLFHFSNYCFIYKKTDPKHLCKQFVPCRKLLFKMINSLSLGCPLNSKRVTQCISDDLNTSSGNHELECQKTPGSEVSRFFPSCNIDMYLMVSLIYR